MIAPREKALKREKNQKNQKKLKKLSEKFGSIKNNH